MKKALLWTALYWALEAEAQQARKYSNVFLELGVGARAGGMANCQTALVSDVTSGYWNPAGLPFSSEKHELALMHAEYFAGVAKFDYAAFSTRVDSSKRIALSAVRFGVDDIPNTLDIRDGTGYDFARITGFSVADWAFILSYGQKLETLVPGLSVGGSVKVVHRSVGPFAAAWGFGLDLGAQYRLKNFSAGIAYRDVFGTFNAWTFNTETFEEAFKQAGQEVPQNNVEITLPSLRLGAAYRFLFFYKKLAVVPALEWDVFFDGKRNVPANVGRMSLDPKAGLEIAYREMVFLRTGVMNIQRVRDDRGRTTWTAAPTVGAGFSFAPISKLKLSIDYTLSNLTGFSANMYAHLVSLRFGFNKVQL
ncbi:MAG: PorV/PorQ family protein [Bacteroidia bacterium]|nr:PorV/PorQ family protein [Bacteroidia bacterium]MDW8333727.1 PorV/PorQ family protein [Bacteroidia bacterium]